MRLLVRYLFSVRKFGCVAGREVIGGLVFLQALGAQEPRRGGFYIASGGGLLMGGESICSASGLCSSLSMAGLILGGDLEGSSFPSPAVLYLWVCSCLLSAVCHLTSRCILMFYRNDGVCYCCATGITGLLVSSHIGVTTHTELRRMNACRKLDVVDVSRCLVEGAMDGVGC